jgi:hypothetical protein
MADRVTAFAQVELVLRVEVGSWGDDCKLDQILSQSKGMARDRIERIFKQASVAHGGDPQLAFPDVSLVKVGMVEVRLVEKQ